MAVANIVVVAVANIVVAVAVNSLHPFGEGSVFHSNRVPAYLQWRRFCFQSMLIVLRIFYWFHIVVIALRRVFSILLTCNDNVWCSCGIAWCSCGIAWSSWLDFNDVCFYFKRVGLFVASCRLNVTFPYEQPAQMELTWQNNIMTQLENSRNRCVNTLIPFQRQLENLWVPWIICRFPCRACNPN